MLQINDPVQVSSGLVNGLPGPISFKWRGNWWRVGDLVAHWVESNPWQYGGVAAVSAEISRSDTPRSQTTLGQREIWRVAAQAATAIGIFDLGFDFAGAAWELLRQVD